MASNDPVDQDAIAAQWEASLDSEDPAEAAQAAAANELTETMALQWAAMVEDGSRDFGTGKNNSERVLSQEEIDNLLGFTDGDISLDDHSGIRAIINSAMVSYERLPMLEIVFDRLVRLMTTILAQFHLRQRRSLARPHHLGALRRLHELDRAARGAERVQGRGVGQFRPRHGGFQPDLFDDRRAARRPSRPTALRVEGRPYTTIETNLVKRLIEVVLADAEQAFRPLSPVTFSIDRLETNPRFAAISRPANAAILVRLRVDMEDRGGNIELLLPYATIEPIRSVLLQMFMGEKFGRDQIWEGHFATEIAQAEIAVEAVLYEADIAAQATDAAEGRRYPAAQPARRRDGRRTLRQRDPDGGANGAGRRQRRHSRHQAFAQAEHDACDVREGGRAEQDAGGAMSHSLGVTIEIAGRAAAGASRSAIACCLNARLKRLKADEHSLKAVIGELITATEIAERAIGGLKLTVRDVNENLGSQIAAATEMSEYLKRQLVEGDQVVRRLSKIAHRGAAVRRCARTEAPRAGARCRTASGQGSGQRPPRRRRSRTANAPVVSPHEIVS